MTPAQDIPVRIARRDVLAEDTLGFRLEPVGGGELPTWQPGAHVDLKLPCTDKEGEHLIRQYSLCGVPEERTCYRIGVLREAVGRGGSAFIHDRLAVGDVLAIGAPRNHFPYEPKGKCLFIAGGIGITPILPMIRAARVAKTDWHLVFAARHSGRMAFLDELTAMERDRVTLHFDDTHGLLDLDALLGPLGAETSVYSCGPTGLLDALEARSVVSAWKLRIERFASAQSADISGGSFDVICASTGERLHVPEGKTVLAVLREAGYRLESSCKDGICGTCETRVLCGTPDHRDKVLTDEEKAENDYMMVCVSRAKTLELELDI